MRCACRPIRSPDPLPYFKRRSADADVVTRSGDNRTSLAPMTKTGSPPRWLRPVNKLIIALNRCGLVVENGAVLTVAGRRSGVPRHVPVSVLDHDGQRYLLAGYPSAEWPRNVRAAGGRATITVGRHAEAVRLVELEEAAAPGDPATLACAHPAGGEGHARGWRRARPHAGVVRAAGGSLPGVPDRDGVSEDVAQAVRDRTGHVRA